MINYKLGYHTHGESKKTLHTFNVEEPYKELSILSSISQLDDLSDFIEWVEDEIIKQNVPDYSKLGAIIHQPILWGSIKSKIGYMQDGKLVGGQEFDTKEFLNVCYAWKKFLNQKYYDESQSIQ